MILTLIPCMCISPLNGVHSSFSFDSGSSMIFPLRDDKTSPDPDDMPSSWISLKHSRYFVTLRPHDFVLLYFAMFCGQQSRSHPDSERMTAASRGGHFQTLTRDIIIIVGREFSQPHWQWQIFNSVIISHRAGNWNHTWNILNHLT